MAYGLGNTLSKNNSNSLFEKSFAFWLIPSKLIMFSTILVPVKAAGLLISINVCASDRLFLYQRRQLSDKSVTPGSTTHILRIIVTKQWQVLTFSQKLTAAPVRGAIREKYFFFR